jgi:hypothetical protein
MEMTTFFKKINQLDHLKKVEKIENIPHQTLHNLNSI